MYIENDKPINTFAPGPGAYNLSNKNLKNYGQYTIATKAGFNKSKFQLITPGPGTYKPINSIN